MNESFANFNLIDHPLVKTNITILRDFNTNCDTFRSAISRLSNIIAVELFVELKDAVVQLPKVGIARTIFVDE